MPSGAAADRPLDVTGEATGTMPQAQDSTGETQRSMRQRAQQVAERGRGGVEHYTRQNPWPAVAAAAGLGFLLARAMPSTPAVVASARGMAAAARERDRSKQRQSARDSNVMVADAAGGVRGRYYRGASMTGHGVGLP